MQRDSYNLHYFPILHKIEEQHFWFRSRNLLISNLLKPAIADLANDYKVLEIGTGAGSTLKEISLVCKGGWITAMDLFIEALHYVRVRVASPLVQADVNYLPFHASNFSIICMFDVLEHVDNDQKVLSELYNILIEKGKLLLTVPAYPSLWSYFDDASHHRRRYLLHELQDKLIRAGFHIEYLGYIMATLFPLVWIKRKLAYRKKWQAPEDPCYISNMAVKELRIVPVLNEVLRFFLLQENKLIMKKYALPFGTSLLAIAQKR